jgi:hypothetical protein
MTVMVAIHGIRGRGGSFMVMMRRNFALARHTAGRLIRRPSGARQRCVKQNDSKQADACRDETVTVLTHSLHVTCGPVLSFGHYIVARHSLQAK